jgi:glycosyltransferase involved in cell wall biosynthesis
MIHNRYRLPGGEDVAVAADCALLRDSGHHVVLHEAVNPTGRVAAARALAVAPWNASAVRAIGVRIRELQPDIVHVHNTWFALGPAPLRQIRDAGIPMVMTTHNFRLVCVAGTLFRDGHLCEECVGTHPWRGVLHRCYRDSAAASLASAVTIATHRAAKTWDGVSVYLAPSAFIRDRLVLGGVPMDRVRVRSNHAPDPGPRVMAPSKSSIVLVVGRLTAEKGVDVLVDAWARHRPGHLELVLVGEGPLRDSLEARAVPGVRFTGQLDRSAVDGLMQRARWLAVPSRTPEVQGLAVIEAMAAGLPTLVTDSGALPEAVDHDPSFLVPVGASPADWSTALATMSDSTLDDAGHKARDRYLVRHTPAAVLTSLLEAYELARAQPN